MAFVYHRFTYQGGASGCTEIADWMTSNFPGMFTSYAASGTNVLCKTGTETRLTLSNVTNAPAGYTALGDDARSLASTQHYAYTSVIADVEANVVVFLAGSAGVPTITLCKNEDGDTCGVALITSNQSNIFVPVTGSIDVAQTFRAFVYNFTQNTTTMIPCGFARTNSNYMCGFPLVDAGGRKIQNVWLGGSSALKNMQNPIEISIGNTIYCCIKCGAILIK